jgi:glycosyltransferase involved in cell wall biosynthesis
MRVLVAQIGARRHYAVPAALEQAGLLGRFVTDLTASDPRIQPILSALPERLRRGRLRRLTDRTVPEVPPVKIRSLPVTAAWSALRRPRRGTDRIYRHWAEANAAFGRAVVRTGLEDIDAVYVFNAAGLEIARAAKDRGLNVFLDQTMAPHAWVECTLAEERERWPGWEPSDVTPADWQPLADRESAEWQLADRIICGSSFVAESVAAEGGPQRTAIIPYGYNHSAPDSHRSMTTRRQLNVLFVGTVGLRKGIPYLLKAAHDIAGRGVSFRAVGPVALEDRAVAELRRLIDLTGPVPRTAMSAHYAWADVLVLPTLAEGSANVCFEALAHGVPVITTPNAGSVVRDGIDGFLTEPRDSQALAERLEQLRADVYLYEEMSMQARRQVKDFSRASYANALLNLLINGVSAVPGAIHKLIPLNA